MAKKIAGFFVIFFVCFPINSAPPVPGKKGFIQKSWVSSFGHLKFMKAMGITAPASTPITYSVLVIRVEFQADFDSSTTGTGTFNAGTTKAAVENFMTRMNDFYYENSYGLISISATVTDGGSGTNNSYQLNHPMSYYGSNDDPNNYAYLLADAVQKAVSEVDFTDYNHYMIFHAGAGEETDVRSDSPNDIWSVYVEGISGITADGKAITNATFVPEYASQDGGTWDAFGIICHEYGHQLGLPDLYRTDTSAFESGVGKWSLMDQGIYSGVPEGSNPSHLDAWCKLHLGLIDPMVLSGDGSEVSIQPAEVPAGGSGSQSTAFARIPIASADDPSNEYFLLEYRSKTAGSYDNYLPASGLLIWHIDDRIGNISSNDVNNNPYHRRVDLIEKDQTDIILEQSSPGDVFSDGDTFSDQIYAAGRAYNGVASGITIASISGVGTGQVTFLSTVLKAAQVVNTLKLNNYPNPSRDGTTTFSFKFTRPPRFIDLDIFTISGEKVLSVGSSEIPLENSSSDYNWIYEYYWDGKNEDGNKVAPGVYLYRVSIDDNITTGKLAILR